MYAVLDLTWKPSADSTSPPVGKAPAIVRNDTYTHTLRITDGITQSLDDGTFIAQLRAARLTSATSPSPVASFTVTEDADGADLLIIITLDSTTTSALPTVPLFWDLQMSNAGVITTLLAGKVKVLDDVSRAA